MLAGRYSLEERVAVGGMGSVHVAAGAREHRPTPTPHATTHERSGNRPDEDGGSRPAGAAVPTGIIGRDGRTVEESLKARGFEIAKADVASAAPKESAVAAVPGPGQPLTPGQTVVLLVSNGKPAETDQSFRVPADVVGADAHDVEERLKAQEVHVMKVPIDSAIEKDTVLGTYPAPGVTVEGSELVLLVSSGHPPE